MVDADEDSQNIVTWPKGYIAVRLKIHIATR